MRDLWRQGGIICDAPVCRRRRPLVSQFRQSAGRAALGRPPPNLFGFDGLRRRSHGEDNKGPRHHVRRGPSHHRSRASSAVLAV